VRLDRARFQQILLNLVSNSADAIEGLGHITISVFGDGFAADGSAEPQSPMHGPSIGVEIADTGTGMDAYVLSRAFEPFFTTKMPSAGIGLGLTQVRGLVYQHRGNIQLISTPGTGTTVRIGLPVSSSTSPVAPKDRAIPRGHGEGVLVVDDDPSVRTAMVNVLAWLGYSPVDTPSGEGGCAVLAKGDPQVAVVISDVKMPGMDGESFLKELAIRWPALPVILMSGDSSGAGASDHAIRSGRQAPPVRLQKPFSSQQIAVAVRTALQSR
jgi:CheY-like chemotaxis protein